MRPITNRVAPWAILRRHSLSAEEMGRHAEAQNADLDAFATPYLRRDAHAPEAIAKDLAEASVAPGTAPEPVNHSTGDHVITRVPRENVPIPARAM
jgi:hypothetical protein